MRRSLALLVVLLAARPLRSLQALPKDLANELQVRCQVERVAPLRTCSQRCGIEEWRTT